MKSSHLFILAVIFFVLMIVGTIYLSQIYKNNLKEVCEDVDLKYYLESSKNWGCFKIDEGRTITYEIDRIGADIYVNKFPKGSNG